MRLHLVCLRCHLLLYGDYLEKLMSGKLVKDINRETIDTSLSVVLNPLVLTAWFLPLLGEAQADDNDYISLHKLLSPPKHQQMSPFYFHEHSVCKIICGSRGKQLTEMFFISFLIHSFSRTEQCPLIKRMICMISTSQTPSNLFLPESIGRE